MPDYSYIVSCGIASVLCPVLHYAFHPILASVVGWREIDVAVGMRFSERFWDWNFGEGLIVRMDRVSRQSLGEMDK